MEIMMEPKVTAIIVAMVATVLFPQPGYIHPDEFFQSVEIVAGDVFNISHHRTWEFNQSFPMRDITLPYLLFAPGFYSLKATMILLNTYNLSMPPSLVIIVPRLIVTVLGLTSVLFIQILSSRSSLKRDDTIWLWVTSYVTWVHLTRTFSNTVETLLFSTVCVLLSESAYMLESIVVKKTTEKGAESTDIIHSKQSDGKFRWPTFCLYCIALGSLVCFGFFNRPTFLLFIFIPMLWWMQFMFCSSRKSFIVAGVMSATAFMTTFILQTLVNTFYYEPECRGFGTVDKIRTSFSKGSYNSATKDLQRAVIDCLHVPPWNFIQYNMRPANLAEHGLHPWYTHLLISLPSLLGPLVVVLYWNLLQFPAKCWRRYKENRLKLGSVEGWLYLAVFVPVLALSVFPHQEPRFLLPIIPVALVCTSTNTVIRTKSFSAVWLAFNVLAFILFGWLHQGGLIPALTSFSSELSRSKSEANNCIHMLFYQTYMPPRHLLLTGTESRTAVTVHDLAGAHPSVLQQEIKKIHKSSLESRSELTLYLALPASVVPDISAFINDWTRVMVNNTDIRNFCPHLSMEKLPSFNFKQLVTQLCLKVYVFSHFHHGDSNRHSPK